MNSRCGLYSPGGRVSGAGIEEKENVNPVLVVQLALECAWLMTKICGNSLQVKKKKKSACSATYWENNEERDVEYEMRMPDGMLACRYHS